MGKILTDLALRKRLPVSVAVVAVVANVSEPEAMRLIRESGGELGTIGDIQFVIKFPPKSYVFEPQPVMTNEVIRDSVLSVWASAIRASDGTGVVRTPCEFTTRANCPLITCQRQHFLKELRPGITDESAGFCSYLDLCRNVACKFVHVVAEAGESEEPISAPVHTSSTSSPTTTTTTSSTRVCCDVRSFPISMLHGHVGAVLLDPPWDIHMELSYGTLTDDEMRNLDMSNVHSELRGGFVFIWATARTIETARDCLRLWGYVRADEIVWVKTNQIGGTVRSGRTGHWLNHNKEHCLVGVKGDVSWANIGKYRQDCDVIVAPVRENSRKPDELYKIIERIVGPERLCLELFGRSHNCRPGWITVGNQLGHSEISNEVGNVIPELSEWVHRRTPR